MDAGAWGHRYSGDSPRRYEVDAWYHRLRMETGSELKEIDEVGDGPSWVRGPTRISSLETGPMFCRD